MIDPTPLLERACSPATCQFVRLGGGVGSGLSVDLNSRSPTLGGGPDDVVFGSRARQKRREQRTSLVQAFLKEWPAMIVTAITTALYAVTYGGLCFEANGLKKAGSNRPNGYTLWLLCGITSQIANQVFSDMPLALSSGTLEMLPIVWAIFDSIADSLQDECPDAILGTCIATLFVSTLGLGILLFVGGRIGVARWLRVVPAVVLKGAVFGVGLFLLASGLENAKSGAELSLADWPHWGLVAFLGSSIFLLDQTWNSPMAIMSTLLSIAVAPAVLSASGMVSFDAMRDGGWLLREVSSGSVSPWYEDFLAVYVETLPHIRWRAVILQMPNILGLWATHLLCTLMDLKTMELILQIDVDLDKELMAVGGGNVLGALCGCIWPVYTPTAPNVTACRMGAESRIGGWAKILSTIPLLFLLQHLVPRLPCALPCSVTFWLGLSFMKETMLNILFQHSHGFDVAIVAVMAAVCCYSGLLYSLFVGSLLAVWSFTFMYTGLCPVVRNVDSASFVHSNVQRSLAENLMVERLGHRIAVLHLEGYIMFGSSPQLLDALRPLLEDEDGPQWIVLSFRSVRGLDYSAVCDISSLGRRAAAMGRSIVITEVRGAVRNSIIRAGLSLREVEDSCDAGDVPKGLCHVERYQPALRLCEDALLSTIPVVFKQSHDDLHSTESPAIAMLRRNFEDFLDGGLDDLKKLLTYFEVQVLPPGETVWLAGQVLDFALGVVKGQLHSLQPPSSKGGEPVLMEVVCGGAFVGMFSMFNSVPYSHTVVVPSGAGPATVLRLNFRNYTSLTQDEPRLVNALLRGFIRRAGYEWRLLSRLAAQV